MVSTVTGVTETEQYLFDLQGYLVVRNVLEPQEVERINTLIDELGLDQPANQINPHSQYRNLMERDEAFRRLIDNPRIMPYLNAWVRSTSGALRESEVRLDHTYYIFSDPGAPAGNLHLGGAPYEPSFSYHVQGGTIFSALTVVSYVLTEAPEGRGGFACIPGSHKSNFARPADITVDSPCVAAPGGQPGDAIIFTEALTHGSVPWTADHQRRVLFYKYAPAYMTLMSSRWPKKLLDLCTPEQRKILVGDPANPAENPFFFDPNAEDAPVAS